MDTDKVNAEVEPPMIRRRSVEGTVGPTPVGKRDIDISATSLRQKFLPYNYHNLYRVLNKQGKDYSNDNATAIQKDYISTNSTREAILESRKQALSVTNADDADARISIFLVSKHRIDSHASSCTSFPSFPYSIFHA